VIRRRVGLFVLLALLPVALWAAVPLISSGQTGKAAKIEKKIQHKQAQVEHLKSKEGVLTTDISRVSKRINVLQDRQDALEADLAKKKAQLQRLQDDLRRTRARLAKLRAKLNTSQIVLGRRMREIYEAGRPDLVTVILNSKGFADLLERGEFMRRINDQDTQIINAVKVAKAKAKKAADRLAKLEQRQQRITSQVQTARNQVASVNFRLKDARAAKASVLSNVRDKRQDAQEDLKALQKEQAKIEGTLNGGNGGPVQGNGRFIWPVNGPITSPFCERRSWEACHPGIDIGVGTGTPIHAAGSGTVALAGPTGGYGNYTCINHGGGISTCYGHQSQINVSVGQHVSQGEVIGLVGCTGLCFGAHLHFEVRINGSVTNPLNYLG